MLTMPAATTEQDLQEYGAHIKHGGFRLSLLVARNVEKGKGHGKRGPTVNAKREKDSTIVESFSKISVNEFAQRSGTSDNRVARHLEAWERAADAGHVPHAAELVPGQDVTLPEDEGGKLWAKFYRSEAAPKVNKHRSERLEKVAEARGVAPAKVKDIASNPKAMAAAIEVDPKTAEVAEQALAERAKKKVAERHVSAARPPRTPEEELAFKQAAAESFFEQKTWIERLHAHVVSLEQDARDWSDQQKRFAADKLDHEIQLQLMMIDMLRGVTDSALADLIDSERDTPGDA